MTVRGSGFTIPGIVLVEPQSRHRRVALRRFAAAASGCGTGEIPAWPLSQFGSVTNIIREGIEMMMPGDAILGGYGSLGCGIYRAGDAVTVAQDSAAEARWPVRRRVSCLSTMRAKLCAAAIAVAACGGNGSSSSGVAETGAGGEPRPAPPAGTSLLVMTYNLNYGVAGDQESMRLIEKSGADVVMLQETNRAWEEALRGALSEVYRHMAFLDPGRRAGGLGFLSRHPIELAETRDSPIGWFPAWRAIVDGPIGKVQLINLHLRPPGRRGGYVRGYFESQVERLRETEEYLTLVSRELPVILAGDFNEDARGRSLQHLVSLGFETVLDRFLPWQPTWRWQTAMGEVRWQLDHIVLTRPLRATAAWVLDGGASDHVPVLARIERALDPS